MEKLSQVKGFLQKRWLQSVLLSGFFYTYGVGGHVYNR